MRYNPSYAQFYCVIFPHFWLIVRGITSITIGGNFVAREHLNFRVRLTGRRCLLLFPFLLSSIYGIREKNWFPKKNLGATKLADFCDNMTIDDCDDGNAILDYLGNYDFQGVVHKVTDPKKVLTRLPRSSPIFVYKYHYLVLSIEIRATCNQE